MIRTVLALMKKEFYQVVRDRNMLRLIFIMPLVQLFVLAYAITTDVKLIYTAVYDHDRSALSREYVRSLTAGDYFVERMIELRYSTLNRGLRRIDSMWRSSFPMTSHDSWSADGRQMSDCWWMVQTPIRQRSLSDTPI